MTVIASFHSLSIAISTHAMAHTHTPKRTFAGVTYMHQTRTGLPLKQLYLHNNPLRFIEDDSFLATPQLKELLVHHTEVPWNNFDNV